MMKSFMMVTCCSVAAMMVLLSSCGVDGQLFSMFLNSQTPDDDFEEAATAVRDNNDDGSSSDSEPKRKKLFVFTKAELAEVSGQDIDLDDADEFIEREDAFIVTMGTNSSRFINRENVAWEVIKLLRTKVMSETEAWMNMKLAEESILEKFKGKQKSLAKIVLKNIWGRRKADHVRQIKNMLDVIQDLYVKLITKAGEGQNATQSVLGNNKDQQVGNRDNLVAGGGNRHKPIVFPGQLDKHFPNSKKPSSALHFPDVPVGTPNQHHHFVPSGNNNNRRKPSVSSTNVDKKGSNHGSTLGNNGFPDAGAHFPDVLSPAGLGGNRPAGADKKQGQRPQSSGTASSSSAPDFSGNQNAFGVSSAIQGVASGSQTSQPQTSAAFFQGPVGSGGLPSTTSEILKLLLVNFNELQQQAPTSAQQPAAQPDPGVEWSYDENDSAGPPKWGEFYPACAGERQSPVDIIVDETEEMDFDDLIFENLESLNDNVSIQHNGHTVKMQLKGPSKIFVNGGGLGSQYVLTQIHFHWGSKIFRGSEHQLERRRFPAEMHMVFRNRAYDIDQTALLHSDGLAVMGFFVNVQPRDNRELDEFFKSLDLVRSPKAKHFINNPINLQNLISPCLEGTFFRYNGSLTTPGCQEAVTWTMFETPIGVSLRQLRAFQRLEEKSGEPLIDNWRPLQPLNGRKILRKRGGIRSGPVSLLNRRARSGGL